MNKFKKATKWLKKARKKLAKNHEGYIAYLKYKQQCRLKPS